MTSLPIFSSTRERTLWVQAQLRLVLASFASIARENGWSRNAVANAMYQASDPQERAIAEKLGVGQQALFPERFNAKGQRLHAVKNSAPSRLHNVKQQQVA